MTKKTWSEFRDAGLLWWINRSLHLFGWAIVFEVDEDTQEVTSVYPARVEYRGFQYASEEKGFVKLTKHLKENIDELVKDVEA